MADREIKKQKFKTVEKSTTETNSQELDKKIRIHRLKILKRILLASAVLMLIAAGFMLMLRLREYTSYEVVSETEQTDTLTAGFLAFRGGVIKYSNDGATYTNASEELVWNQTFEMQDTLVDECEDYVVFAEKGGNHVYILNSQKLQGSFETTMEIVAVRVANQGTVAILMEKDQTSYIRLYDKEGKNLAGGQIGVENAGYPLDIALSNDAIKMAVTMLDINEGNIKSMIAFYNFGSVGQNEIDHMVGTYSYSNMVIPQIDFISNDRMIAFGDSKVLIFEGTQKPTVSKEIDLQTEMKSVFYNQNYFGLVNNNEDKNNTRHMEIYDTKGGHVLSKDFALDYDTIEFLANNEICIRNEKECQIYNTYGVKHFSYTYDTPLFKVLSGRSSRDYTFVLEGKIEKVKLK